MEDLKKRGSARGSIIAAAFQLLRLEVLPAPFGYHAFIVRRRFRGYVKGHERKSGRRKTAALR